MSLRCPWSLLKFKWNLNLSHELTRGESLSRLKFTSQDGWVLGNLPHHWIWFWPGGTNRWWPHALAGRWSALYFSCVDLGCVSWLKRRCHCPLAIYLYCVLLFAARCWKYSHCQPWRSFQYFRSTLPGVCSCAMPACCGLGVRISVRFSVRKFWISLIWVECTVESEEVFWMRKAQLRPVSSLNLILFDADFQI